MYYMININEFEYEFLPEINSEETEQKDNNNLNEVIVNSPCPCCRYITIPNNGDALAYICPVCMWEIDLFIKDENESSDLNHGLSLKKARENYKKFGSSQQRLIKYCRVPKDTEKF